MVHISIYIGETFMNQTRVIDAITTSHDHHFIFVDFIMSIIGTPMSATTTGLMPLKARNTYSLSLKDVKNIATSNIIRQGGRQLAMVATTLPFVPLSLYPVSMEMFTAKSPGAVWASVMSRWQSWSCVYQVLILEVISCPARLVSATPAVPTGSWRP